jgi:hypothetical protein
MDIVSWSSGRIGDSDMDGNFEVELKGIRIFSAFSVPDIKVEMPTAAIAAAFISFGEKIPWASAIGSLLRSGRKK